jgi:hypothetical protein
MLYKSALNIDDIAEEESKRMVVQLRHIHSELLRKESVLKELMAHFGYQGTQLQIVNEEFQTIRSQLEAQVELLVCEQHLKEQTITSLINCESQLNSAEAHIVDVNNAVDNIFQYLKSSKDSTFSTISDIHQDFSSQSSPQQLNLPHDDSLHQSSQSQGSCIGKLKAIDKFIRAKQQREFEDRQHMQSEIDELNVQLQEGIKEKNYLVSEVQV